MSKNISVLVNADVLSLCFYANVDKYAGNSCSLNLLIERLIIMGINAELLGILHAVSLSLYS